jgi:hypothetical protein
MSDAQQKEVQPTTHNKAAKEQPEPTAQPQMVRDPNTGKLVTSPSHFQKEVTPEGK